MKKLLFLIHNLNPAGAQRVLVDFVNSFDAGKYDITVQTIADVGVLKDALNENIHYKTIISNKNKFLAKIKAFLLRRIIPSSITYNLFIKGDFDYEVAYLEGPCAIYIAPTNKNTKKIAWIHTDLETNNISQNLFKTKEEYKEVYRSFDNIVCVSNGIKEAFLRYFNWDDKEKIQPIVFHNIIDDERIYEKASVVCDDVAFAKVENGVNFISVANIRPEKGFDRLLENLYALKEKGYKFKVHFIGSGVDEEKIKKMADNLNLIDVVTFLGPKKNPYPYLKESDCLIISSYAEGFSTVAIEATLLEVPTLTTNCTGMDEIFDGGKYAIVTENSKEGLYRAMEEVLSGKIDLSDIKAPLKEYKENFAKKKRIQEAEELFK